MKYLILVILMGGGINSTAFAQNSARDRAEGLRQQLTEVETKQAALQARLRQLEEELKPENIEKTLAGVGSTRPEDLREQRRRKLEIERKGIQGHLDLLATSHTRLEGSLAQADADAYRESAGVGATGTLPRPSQPTPNTSQPTNANPQPVTPTTVRRARRVKRKKSRSRRVVHSVYKNAESQRVFIS